MVRKVKRSGIESRSFGSGDKEEFRQERRRIRKEEEEEDIEIRDHYQRLEYMRENSSVCDGEISCLIEEQQELLQALCMKKQEFLDDMERAEYL